MLSSSRLHSPLSFFIFIPTFLIVFTSCNRNYEGGTAPSGSMSVRHQWGIQNLGPTYLRVREWIMNSKVIESKIGKVIDVAPVGDNPTSFAFTDGWSCTLSLEVIGSQGSGTAQAPSAFIDSSSGKLYFMILWKDHNGKDKIHSDDISYQDYYSPSHYLTLLNKQITASAANPESFYRRAQVHFLLNLFQKAEDDIRLALKKQITWSPTDHRTQREYLRTLVLILSANKKTEALKTTLEELEKLPARHSYDQCYDLLLQWTLQTRLGNQDSATAYLQQKIEKGTQEQKQFVTYVSFKEATDFIFRRKPANPTQIKWKNSLLTYLIVAHLLSAEKEEPHFQACLQHILQESKIERRDYIRLYAEWLLRNHQDLPSK